MEQRENNKSVALVPTVQRPLAPSEHEMAVYQAIAKNAVESQMYRNVGKEAGVMMIMLAARELGIPPMQALNKGLQIIEGNVEISARMMNAMIRRAGHSIQIKESSSDKCVLSGRRCDNGDTATVVYSVGDAQQAGLIREKGGWKKSPTDMCFARAISRLARQLFPDVIGIGYVEGEISGESTDNAREMHVEEQVEVEIQTLVPPEPPPLYTFLDQLPAEEVDQWIKFVAAVSEKLNWTEGQTILEFQKDIDKTREKFKKWLSKERK